MSINKAKLKKKLFTKYNIVLSDDDPFWLLMLMQKDMTEEVLSATKTAISNNRSLGNINRKALVITGVVSFIFGVLVMSGYSYYRVQKAEDSAFKINTKLTNNLVHSFALQKTKKEMGEYSYTEVGDGQNPLLIKINGVEFKTHDIINGWQFEKAQDMFKKAFFTNVKNPDSVFTANLKKVQ